MLIFLPMSTPEVVPASLLTMFVSTTSMPFVPEGLLFPLNIRTILIAHVMFCISYVVVTVKARLQNFRATSRRRPRTWARTSGRRSGRSPSR